jgi:hypothetical protein
LKRNMEGELRETWGETRRVRCEKPEKKQGGRFARSLKRNREGDLHEAWRETLGLRIYNGELIFLLLDWKQINERRRMEVQVQHQKIITAWLKIKLSPGIVMHLEWRLGSQGELRILELLSSQKMCRKKLFIRIYIRT